MQVHWKRKSNLDTLCMEVRKCVVCADSFKNLCAVYADSFESVCAVCVQIV